MGFYGDDLLKKSYANFIKSGNRQFTYIPSNGMEMNRYLEAAQSLVEKGYIYPESQNIMNLEYNPISEGFIHFDITDTGIEYVEEKLK